MDAIVASNRLDTAYDGDAWSLKLDAAFSDLFETQVRALWVTTGTAANCLALAALCPPHGGIICHRDAHIEVDEAGAPGFFTHGAKLMLVDGPGAKLDARCGERSDRPHPQGRPPGPAARAVDHQRDRIWPRPTPRAEVAALGELAKAHGLRFHMDGARFANAIAATGASPADLTWRAGVDGDVVRLRQEWRAQRRGADPVRHRSGRRNPGPPQARRAICCPRAGCSPRRSWRLLDNDLWLANARAANAAAQVLAKAAPATASSIRSRPMRCSSASARTKPPALRAQGFDFYDWGAGEIRLVTSWDSDPDAVDQLAAAIASL